MTRLILHIGLHKTGTTSIQRFLSRNRWLLRKAGVFYPEGRNAKGHRTAAHVAFSTAIQHQGRHGAPHPDYGSAEDQIAWLERGIKESRPPFAIVSAEDLSSRGAHFAEILAPLAERYECRIVCFLRRQDYWIESFYKQAVASRRIRQRQVFTEYIARPRTRRLIDYHSLLGWWAEAFGDDAMRVRVFEPEVTPFNPVRELVEASGIPSWIGRLPWSTGHANASQSVEATEAIRLANAAEQDVPLDAAAQIDARLDHKTRAFMSLDDRRAIMAAVADGNAEIARRWLDRPDGRLFGAEPSERESRPATWSGFESEAAGRPALELLRSL